KLFQSCCNIYVPKECRSLCVYETNQNVTRELLVSILRERKCGLEYLSSILYCASQNRDNRKCCIHLNLNDPQLQVGSRCLRMCDPTGTAIEQITMEDATCMYNWNLVSILRERKCGLEYLSSILYCASQNRDNRKCCIHLNLNDPQLQVGSRCLRMCDPTGTAIEQITMEDATCMYNWNVIMYCHHSGIREM
ncbi:unnamed protein product, partial [Brugia pahangi]|uniref:DB domain-containing protein n=1 Tax=Brugia pahangi TaxID=6280 RepID=A0A0N4TCV0_BRUPA